MTQVKAGFRGLSVPAKIQQAKNIVNQMTGNANFASPNPTLAAVSTAIADLEASFEAAKDGGKSKTALMHTHEKVLDTLMSQLASYVHEASEGDEIKILSSGMQTRALPSAPQPVSTPTGLIAATGKMEGEVLLTWKTVTKGVAYLIEQSADGSTGWATIGNSTKGKFTVTGLVSGSKVWFRVCAIGTKGNGPWSDPARGMAG